MQKQETTIQTHNTIKQPEPVNESKVRNILVDGATGYIGSHLVHALKELSAPQLTVRCLVRNAARNNHIEFLKSNGAQLWQGNLDENDDTLTETFTHVDVACHLIGSIAPRRGETSASIHVKQTERFIQHCLKGRVAKIIMVSACGASAHASTNYHRTKWQAEQIIKESGIPAIILRPSLVIGKTAGFRNSKLISRLQDLILNRKSVPLVAGGYNKVQPLFINDLIEAVIASIFVIEGGSYTNVPVFELGGPEVLTLRELTRRLMKSMGKEHPIMDLPAPVAIALAYLSEALQAVPLLSRDQVKLAQQDNICSDNQLPALIKRSPTSITDALASYNA